MIQTAPQTSALLHASPHLWRAASQTQLAQQRQPTIATGQANLDAQLAGDGWPAAGVTELLHTAEGIGELQLLLPALAHLTRTEHKWVAWVKPPHMPSGPALAAAGVDVDRLLIIHPKDHKQTLWCLEQALKSGTCSAVLGWPDASKLQAKEIRRLQLAARQGGTAAFLFRPEQAAEQSSPAELRLQLRAGTVRVLKRRGGWATEWFALEDHNSQVSGHPDPSQHLQEQLLLWRHQRTERSGITQEPAQATAATRHAKPAASSNPSGRNRRGSLGNNRAAALH